MRSVTAWSGCSGRHGEVVDGAVWSYQAWQARFNEVRLGAVRHGSAGAVGLRVVRFGSVN